MVPQVSPKLIVKCLDNLFCFRGVLQYLINVWTPSANQCAVESIYPTEAFWTRFPCHPQSAFLHFKSSFHTSAYPLPTHRFVVACVSFCCNGIYCMPYPWNALATPPRASEQAKENNEKNQICATLLSHSGPYLKNHGQSFALIMAYAAI